jgi:hypothetical protein
MAAVVTLGAIDVFVLGSTGTLTALTLFGSTFQNIKQYLDSGKLIDLLPANTSAANRQLVVSTGVGDLTPVDGFLVGSSTAGLLLLLNPKFRLAGGLTLLVSIFSGSQRDNAKLIAVTSAGLAATIANPLAAGKTAIGLAGVAANATMQGISSAIQLSATAIGAIVTVSGAVVGYLLVKEK